VYLSAETREPALMPNLKMAEVREDKSHPRHIKQEVCGAKVDYFAFTTMQIIKEI